MAPRLPTVSSDKAQLESALVNVVINARDAMPGGGVITLAIAREHVGAGVDDLAPGDYVRLMVADEGEGMDENTLARSTEPFFTTKGVGKGTGLGLAMIHGLTMQSGGGLRLRSRLGIGTEVELWLPVATDDSARPASQMPIVPVASARQLMILAVDDDELVLINTVAMLEDLGHTVFQASNGEEALKVLAEAKPFDLLITDHAMPNMTGAQLARKVVAEQPGLPIILATGFAELPSGEGAGLTRLEKPFGQAQLAEAIGRILQTR
jgi:CheY-like chemotaxis protein